MVGLWLQSGTTPSHLQHLHHLQLHCLVNAMAEGSAGYATPKAARPRNTRSLSGETLRLTPNLHGAPSPVNPVNPGQESQEVLEVVEVFQVEDSQVSQGQEEDEKAQHDPPDQPDHADGPCAVPTESTVQTGMTGSKDSQADDNDDEDTSSAAAGSVSRIKGERAGTCHLLLEQMENQQSLLREVRGLRHDMVKSFKQVGAAVNKLAEEVARSRSPAKHAK